MNILITNDDGWGSKGIMLLARVASQFGHVTVLAPDGARSAMSNAVTSTKPMTLRKIETTELPDADVYVTSGTPSDCIKLAINVLFGGDPRQIDLVLSGINHGSNAAINIIYSGTMGACFVAVENGIPAIGFSIDDHDLDADFEPMSPYIPQIIQHLIDEGIPAGCYNINAPKGEIHGIKWCRQCRSHWEKEMEPVTLDNGETAYQLTGYMVNDEPETEDTDQYALEHGYISIQPCTVDMTAYAAL
ncbi:MAG: 5'/3'-nucleotidase SurE [Paludibacteraceae bacterium]|nr:5'/3'-nucleotidase SurE [Paludibacteraceae bacterium]